MCVFGHICAHGWLLCMGETPLARAHTTPSVLLMYGCKNTIGFKLLSSQEMNLLTN